MALLLPDYKLMGSESILPKKTAAADPQGPGLPRAEPSVKAKTSEMLMHCRYSITVVLVSSACLAVLRLLLPIS